MKRLYEKGRYNKFHKQNIKKCIAVSNALDINAELDKDDEEMKTMKDLFLHQAKVAAQRYIITHILYYIYINTIHTHIIYINMYILLHIYI
jgi:hypothetical protein